MDASNVQPAAGFQAMDADMDIDMDIDLTTADDIEAFDTEGITIDDTAASTTASGAPNAVAKEPQLEKVNIEGVDNLTTAQVKAYALGHYPSDHYVRIEWIDDSHANIVYETGNAALEALVGLTDPAKRDLATAADTLEHALEQRDAKPFFDNPEVQLKIRLAVNTDVKAPRAHEASRFYLMNPDKDPWERRRRQPGDRRNGGGDGYNRRRYDDREQRRRKDNAEYDMDMYDEEGSSRPRNASRRPRRGSLSDDSLDDRRRGRRREAPSKNLDDLLPSKADGRLRDRSASPLRDGDGRYGFEEDDGAAHRRIRRRSYSPPSNRLPSGNGSKELFPGRGGATKELFPGAASKSTLLSSTASSPNPSTNTNSNSTKELFPSKGGHTHGKRSRELFPHKTAHSNHRRQDAYDSRDLSEQAFTRPRSLEERITGGPNSNGRLNGEDQGFAVKGSADAPGFSIRGAADVRELFPMKSGAGSNAGKELFSEKIQGRGEPRRKADMYF
ncbi:putative nucleotide-binding alpha-beta plait protein [Lasiodiplodia theobromae]|uniref:Uncharacterized protein n=1 Tax=Lasiodiplodia theobromae TaxID=45133 RepID=A0A5N5DAT8_9PEZI|nr:Nucleotide-binding alpha-beta plait [Lasiodiplodia theobromae]KAB2574918.1 hypothetical protein DBV05_g6427 [Lasiodiplodia theobromae]KAF4540274.1 Nucleotide-binding alpha-beta plait [Lasiodiplodia theobromae]KAF9637095.1 putative nucleotide-binding alpha-beta plait protein [Lasiodiplodia theobromae]